MRPQPSEEESGANRPDPELCIRLGRSLRYSMSERKMRWPVPYGYDKPGRLLHENSLTHQHATFILIVAGRSRGFRQPT